MPHWHNQIRPPPSCTRPEGTWAKTISLTIGLKKIIRSRKPEKHQAQLHARADTVLSRARDIAGRGRLVFVPDTNIYIMNAAGILPQAATIIVDRGLMFHCSVCLAEISTGIGHYAPKAPEWQGVADHYADMFASIPTNRLLVPDAQTWAEAGMVAGILARTQACRSSN